MHVLTFSLVFVFPVALVAGAIAGGAWPLVVVALAFVVLPLVDLAGGEDTENPDDAAVAARGANPLYDALLFAWVPIQLAVVAMSVSLAPTLDPLAFVALAFGTAVTTGAGGINIAHELMHRANPAHKAAAEILMTAVSYPWFCVEHVLGHHRNVATPLDPGTSRLGETLYAFLPRTLSGGLRSAWRLEAARVARRGVTGLGDRRVRMLSTLLVTHAAAALLGGPLGWGMFALQSLVAILLLETINYIEHYGLLRAPNADGSGYERVRPIHSWNSPHRVTGRFLFQLPRHADHHAYASRPYWALRHHADAPAMPLGYPSMVVLALFPPLWFRVMDERVAALHTVRTGGPAFELP